MHHREIYVVDHDTSARKSIFFALTTIGYKVRSLSGSREFLEQVPSLGPGCVLLDLRLPEIDGMQVIERLGDAIRLLPVIVTTADGDIAVAVEAMKLGASDFLEKPFEMDRLLAATERVFRHLETQVNSSGCKRAAQALVGALTRREREVLEGLVAGLPNKVIAYRLGLSIRTVEMHRASMMHRLGVRSLPEALRISFIARDGAGFDGGIVAPWLAYQDAA